MSQDAEPTEPTEPGQDVEQECRRLGLACGDCLPRSRWCDLCTARREADEQVHQVHQVEQRNRDWGYDTLDIVTDFQQAQRIAQDASDAWVTAHDRDREDLFWHEDHDPTTGRTVTRSWGDVFRITTFTLTFT